MRTGGDARPATQKGLKEPRREGPSAPARMSPRASTVSCSCAGFPVLAHAPRRGGPASFNSGHHRVSKAPGTALPLDRWSQTAAGRRGQPQAGLLGSSPRPPLRAPAGAGALLESSPTPTWWEAKELPGRLLQTDQLPATGSPRRARAPGRLPPRVPAERPPGPAPGLRTQTLGKDTRDGCDPIEAAKSRRAHGESRLCFMTLGESRPQDSSFLSAKWEKYRPAAEPQGRAAKPRRGLPAAAEAAPRPASEHALPPSPHKLALGAGETAAPAPRIKYSYTRQARSLSGSATCRHAPPPG